MRMRPAGNPQETEENRDSATAPQRNGASRTAGNPQKTWSGQGGQQADNSATATADKGGQAETRRGHRADKGGQRGLSGGGQADSAPVGARCPPCLSGPSAPASGPSASALEGNKRGDPSAALADPLARAARLIAGLRPDWRDAVAFYERRSEVLDLLRRAAASPCAGCEAAALRDRARRLEALLRHAGAEAARYRRLLASAVRPPRRRRPRRTRDKPCCRWPEAEALPAARARWC
jgi:hypothetical protein